METTDKTNEKENEIEDGLIGDTEQEETRVGQEKEEPPTTQEFFEVEYQDIKIRIGSQTFLAPQLADISLNVINILKQIKPEDKPPYLK